MGRRLRGAPAAAAKYCRMPSAAHPVGEKTRRSLPRTVGRALLVALGTLLLVDLSLRLLPPPPFVPPAPLRGRLVHLTHSDLVTVDYEARTPPFTLRPAPGTRRIVTCGSSSTYGLGLPPQGAWPWILDASAGTDAAVEVVDLARVGATSSDQVHIVREALALRPTCVVVMEGNNEFLPVMAARAAHVPLDPARELALLRAARASRIVAWVRAASVRPPDAGAPDASEPEGLSQVRVTDDDVALARETYRENLREIARMCRDAKVPLVLCTVPVNLAWPPSVDDTPPALRPLGDEARRALDAGRPAEALQALARVGNGSSATLRWLESRARGTSGVAAGMEAVRLDPHPLRTRPDFDDVVRAVAAEYGLTCCDLARTDAGPDRSPLLRPAAFLDGCHFSAAGADRVAREVGDTLRRLGILNGALAPAPASAAGWIDLSHFGDLPTFLAAHRAALPPSVVAAFEDAYRRYSSVSFTFADGLPRFDPAAADDLTLLALYGHCFTTAHRYRRAADCYRRAIALGAPAQVDLGWALYLDGLPAQALEAWPAAPRDRVTRRARQVLEAAR